MIRWSGNTTLHHPRSPPACSLITARAQQQRLVHRQAKQSDADAFFNLRTGPQLFDKVESLLPLPRERLLPPTATLAMFLSQALSADRSCQKAVNDAAVKRLGAGLPPGSTHPGGYCTARRRLPEERLRKLAQDPGQEISGRVPPAWRWRGRPVRLVEGTTVTLPDTPANQAVYPQARTQKPGLGYPICRVLGLGCLDSGAVLNAAVGRFRGKGGDEQPLLRAVLETLEHGEVWLGDAYFATDFLLCPLIERGVDAVFEQYGARNRSTDFRCGKRLGPRDHLSVLQKPPAKPDWMSQAHYDQAPETVAVRALRTGGKTLVTTLWCSQQTAKSEIRALDRSRWQIELDLRNIKATLGMATLSCLTPARALTALWGALLAYNLIRLMLAQAAVLAACLPRALSFKHTVQRWIAWGHCGQPRDNETFHSRFVLISQQQVGDRPGRTEPRAVKRRHKPYPLLTKSRPIAREYVKKYGHLKKQRVK